MRAAVLSRMAIRLIMNSECVKPRKQHATSATDRDESWRKSAYDAATRARPANPWTSRMFSSVSPPSASPMLPKTQASTVGWPRYSLIPNGSAPFRSEFCWNQSVIEISSEPTCTGHW